MQSPTESSPLPSTLAPTHPQRAFGSAMENYLKEESMQLLNSSMVCCTHKAGLNNVNISLCFLGGVSSEVKTYFDQSENTPGNDK